MSLADRMRAIGVSEERIFSMGLARRSGELPDTINDAELALAHEYERANGFERGRIRARNPEGLNRGRDAVRAIEAWLEAKKINQKHGFEK